MARCLVTGGAGFIGSHLAESLVHDGHEVIVVDDLSTGKLKNLAAVKDSVRFIEADVRKTDALRDVMAGVDTVFHQAALPSVPRSVRDPQSSNSVNVDGTLSVLVAARDCGVRRVVYASSSSVYGDTLMLPKTEDMRANPVSPYAVSKYAGELYCQVFWRVYRLETVALRYFNVFGPRQAPDSQYAAVVPRFLSALLEGRAPEVYGDGEQSRDFTFVDNVVTANLLASQAPEAPGQVFNIAGGATHTVNDLISELQRLTGATTKPVYVAERPGDIRHSWASITLAKKALAYVPRVTFSAGLARTVAEALTDLGPRLLPPSC
jgi:UDP-glucose 4-epimerase